MSRGSKLVWIPLEENQRIRRDPPPESMVLLQHLLNCFLDGFQQFLVFWKAERFSFLIFWFCGLSHVSIVEFQVDLCKMNGFACVINELGGGLPDLG